MISILIVWNLLLTAVIAVVWWKHKSHRALCELRNTLNCEWKILVGRQVIEALRVTQQIEREKGGA